MTITTREAEEAKTNLLAIAAAWPRLQDRLRPGSGSALDGRVTGGGVKPLPIDVHVSDLMREIENEARSLAHVLCDEVVDADGQPWKPRTSAMPELLREVAGHYGHWTTSDDRTATAYCDWAWEYAGKVRATLERPEPPIALGPCPQPGCDGALKIKPGRTRATCPVCGQDQDINDQRAWLRERMETQHLTQSEVTSALRALGHEIPFATVRTWVRRRRLVEVEDGLYRFGDAVELAEARSGRIGA